MKFLVAGLGSMGRRRIRNLRELGYTNVVGYDVRKDRRVFAASKYGIRTISSLSSLAATPDVIIISTPPAAHLEMLGWAADLGVHAFVEASVSDRKEARTMREIAGSSASVMVPSCTMRYFRGPTRVREIVAEGIIGRPLMLTHHVGQWLPDWHPWERVEDFYVSERKTGGCREIVPFEFTWLREIFGAPTPVSCRRGHISDLEVDIDDYYHSVVEFPGGLIGLVTIEVFSQPRATRDFRLLGSRGSITFGGPKQTLRVDIGAPDPREWDEDLDQGVSEADYIYPEAPYVAELRDFLEAVQTGDGSIFPNDFIRDEEVLRLLNELEDMSR